MECAFQCVGQANIEQITTAAATNVFVYSDSGVTHEELWRHSNPIEYTEAYPDSQILGDASPLEQLDIYPPQFGIAQQSLWWGGMTKWIALSQLLLWVTVPEK